MNPNCEKCPFRGQRQINGMGYTTEGTKVLVFDAEQFDVVIVGMAPAIEELMKGHPFVGASGVYLRKTLSQLGITTYYMTNVLLCQITTEDEREVYKAAECCKERLVDEIKSKHPKLTIALGDLPLHTLVSTSYKIREIEGRVVPSGVGALLPITHPAYYLRRPQDAMDFIECMRAGVRILDGVYQQATNVTHTVVTPDNLTGILEKLNQYEFLSVDTETTGYSAVKLHPNEILEMGIAVSSTHAYIIPKPLILAFKDLLARKKCIGWNIKFDYLFLRALGIILNIYFDGMLAHYRLDERPAGHGLKKVARIYLGSSDWEADIKKYLPHPKTDSYAIIPTDARYVYLSKDACRTYQLWQVLAPEVENDWVFWNILMPATRMFSEIEFKGIKIDPYKVAGMHTYLMEDIDKAEKELYHLAGRHFNPRSPYEVADVLYDDFQVPMNSRYGRSTNKDLLEEYRYVYPIVDKVLSYRELVKMEGTYIQGFVKSLDNDFRIHPSFKLFGTVTGRLSSEDPSIMNVKRDSKLKEIYLPEPGHLLAEFDFKQNELRWYCIYVNDETLKEVLIQEPTPEDPHRGDPHYTIGAIAFGPDKAMELRVAAKEIVFGRLYLRGYASIEEEFGTNTTDELVKAMDSLMPKHKEYVKNIKAQVRSLGYVESYFLRRRRFPLIVEQNRHEVDRQAVNMPTQSAGSDLNLLCMLHLWNIRNKYDIQPMFCVHDNTIVSVPNEEVVSMIKKEIEDKAYEIVEGVMPFKVKTKYGPSWGEVK